MIPHHIAVLVAALTAVIGIAETIMGEPKGLWLALFGAAATVFLHHTRRPS